MRIIIFGATGMVGQGVLRQCLAAADVEAVLCIGRSPISETHPKLRNLIHKDMFQYEAIDGELMNFDACFFCLGISSNGLSEVEYTHQTYDLTIAAASTLVRNNPKMTFIYVSGAGTDSSEKGQVMWARVKGKTENALQKLPFKAVYLFRPGVIQPLDGAQSKTRSYRLIYNFSKPILPILHRLFPNAVLTTRIMGDAILNAARFGAPRAILEAAEIAALARG